LKSRLLRVIFSYVQDKKKISIRAQFKKKIEKFEETKQVKEMNYVSSLKNSKFGAYFSLRVNTIYFRECNYNLRLKSLEIRKKALNPVKN
jgi:hypothetical protein